ncbi:hypothetical protein [Corynebacterium sp.]|uniref:hypothetical protein n=1 Tax=Corynebacterium sp. TaxID=1720 RepID=UPI0026479F67|nr:hypothetical protein [Corynebacterium sp.]MDN5721255.1 hypothetical protein [Corynebacterium sp.]
MTFSVPPVPPSAVYWTTLDTDGDGGDPEGIEDADLRFLVAGLMDTHGALRAVVAPDGTCTVPEQASFAPGDVIAEERTGPGALAASLDPASGQVWRVSLLSPARLLLCVYRGIVDAESWATLVADARSLLGGHAVAPAGDWGPQAQMDPPAPFDGGGPSTYKTFDVSDADALLELLPAQLGVSHDEIMLAAVLLARACAGLPDAPVALRARGRTSPLTPGVGRTVGRLDRQYVVAAASGLDGAPLLTGGPAVLATLTHARDALRGGTATDAATDAASGAVPAATVEVSAAKVSVSGPVRPVDGVPHVILGTQRLARVTVVDERGGAGGELIWPHLEQALISLSALARLIDAGVTEAVVPAAPVPATSINLFGRGSLTADRTVDLSQLPEVNGFEIVKRLQATHPGGTTLVRLPGVTDPKATGGRSGRVGSGVTGRLITG